MLTLNTYCPVKAQNAGLFISRGAAMHPTRVIGSHELIFIKQGELEMWEEDRHFHLETGDALHLWPGRKHGGSKPMPLGLKFYWVHFEVEAHAERDYFAASNDFLPVIKIPQVTHLSQPERMERLFRSFLDDQENGSLHAYGANLLTMLMLTEIVNANEERCTNTDNMNAVATWAHNYIRINYDRVITTSKVAEAVGYNADYLGRIYRDVYGYTLTEAIHRRRVSVACDFLLDSNLTIEQIAQKCGFTDPDYFRRVFRRLMQTSPGDYRKEYSRVHVNTH